MKEKQIKELISNFEVPWVERLKKRTKRKEKKYPLKLNKRSKHHHTHRY
jgi:hypothetical protein